jgi:GH24 family phage-related lysozyme (muramidase)
MSGDAWKFAELVLTLLVVPVVMWFLNRKQTTAIKADNAQAAKEVKADLAVAKIELKQEQAVATAEVMAEVKAVQEVATETKKIANGDRAAKEAEIRRLRAKMRDKGHDPDEQ